MPEFMIPGQGTDVALSPIVALGLLLAIVGATAIFVTICVFGTTDDFRAPRFVTISVTKPAADQIVVRYTGGKDGAMFMGANVTIEKRLGSSATGWRWTDGKTNGPGHLDATVGSSTTAIAHPGTTWSGENHVVVVGWFSGTQRQVLVDTYI